MLSASQCAAYAEFFARVPSMLAFVGCMSFVIEYLRLRGH